MKFLLSLLLLISVVHAKDFTRGKGKFRAADEDSYDFIKKQLLHEAFKDIISKELTKMGLNKELFWQKYQEKLTLVYEDLDKRLKEKYKIDEKSKAKDKVRYLRELRRAKLVRERKYGGINTIIPRWVVKKISRSQNYPRNRYIQVEGEVNTAKLTKTYYRFVKGKKVSDYGSLYVRVHYNFDGISYSDLEIENEKDFDGVITGKWLEWFKANKPQNIANVVILDREREAKLKSYLSLPSEQMMDNIPEVFVNSLLLDLDITIENVNTDKNLRSFDFNYSGFAYLKNLQSNIVINSYKLNKESKNYRLSPDANLANILANHVYRMAKGYFPRMAKDIKSLNPISTIQRVSFYNFPSISEVNSLLEVIQTRGVKYSLKTEVESIAKDKADVIFYYDGEIGEIKGLIQSLKPAKKDLSIELVETNGDLGIKFTGSVGEKI